MSTYADIVAALVTRFKTVTALNKENTKSKPVGVLDYEPQTIQKAPVLYGVLTSFDRNQTGQVTNMIYIMTWRLCIQWQDNQQAERALMPFINLIPAALDADRTLGGVQGMGEARIESATAGYVGIANTLHRIVDYRVRITHKAPYGSGI